VRITLVTPCYNAARFIAETIESVLAQDVPDLEYFVLDGGSKDGTPEVIRRYESRLAWWVSEPDSGQTNAINRGLKRATGDVLGFLNADDVLTPGALRAVLEAFEKNTDAELAVGEVEWIDAASAAVGTKHSGSIANLAEALDIYRVWWGQRQFVQPEVFFRRSLWERVGAFDEGYHLAFDYDYWVRCFRAGARVAKVPRPLVRFRLHDAQKSVAAEEAANEIRAIVRKTLDADPPIPRSLRRRIEAQLSYDLYQLGRESWAGQPRPSFGAALLRHPSWIFSPEVRARLQSACQRRLFHAKDGSSHP
jgi:glycosyltransferase involved in cell wall biosynthesis